MNGDDPEEGVRLLHRAYSLGAPDTHIDFYRDFAELSTAPMPPAWATSTRLVSPRSFPGNNVRRAPSSTSDAARALLRRPFARLIRAR